VAGVGGGVGGGGGGPGGLSGAGVRPVDRPHVAVIGASDAGPVERALAFSVGEGLARAGAVVICGGGGGVMEAACRGARLVADGIDGAGVAGGVQGVATIGILPGLDRTAANPYVDVAIATGLGEMRNGLVVRSADALIAVGGAFGTLSEIALALHAGKRVVGLGTWELARDGLRDEAIVIASDATAAVRVALAAAQLRDEDA
jgi:uncharacterized protein (TIGR00725 family)